MAIDKRLQIYDEQGNLVDYDILASDVKFSPDGKDLPTKLAEMQDEIEDAGSGDGTVTGVKIGSTTYEPTDGVVDLSSPMSNKVDKNGTDSLMTAAEHTKLGNLPTSTELATQMNAKANDNVVVKTISVNGGQAQTPQNGNVDISVEGAAGEDGKSAYQSYLDTTSDNPKKTEAEWVASLKGADGNDGITGGVDDVVVFNNFSTVPEQGDDINVTGATIGYGMYQDIQDLESRVDDLEEDSHAVEIAVSGDTLVIVTDPTLQFLVANQSAINFGDTLIGGGGKTRTITVRGRKLTSNIAVAVSGTGFSASPASITVNDEGRFSASVEVAFSPASGTTAGAKTGTLTLTSGTTVTTIQLSGNAAAEVIPTISLSPTSIEMSAQSGGTATEILRVVGNNLSAAISLAVTSGIGVTLSQESLSPDSNGDVDANVTVTYTAGSSDVSGTITASSTGATSVTASVVCTVSELPSGYTKLLKITPSASGAYIATNHVFQETPAGFRMEIALDSNHSVSAVIIAGINEASNGRNALAIQGSALRWKAWANDWRATFDTTNVSADTDGLYKFELGVKTDTSLPYIKDIVGDSESAGSTAVSSNANITGKEISLFRGGSDFYTGGIGRVTIYEGNNKVADLIPCKDSNDVVGMYDTVANAFLTSADTSKTFTGTPLN